MCWPSGRHRFDPHRIGPPPCFFPCGCNTQCSTQVKSEHSHALEVVINMTNRQTTDVLAPGCDAMKLQRAGTAHAMYLTVVTCTDTCNVLLLFKYLLSQWPLLYHHFVPRLVAVKLSKGVIQGPWTKNSIRAVPCEPFAPFHLCCVRKTQYCLFSPRSLHVANRVESVC